MAKINATIILLMIFALAGLTGLALVIRSIMDRNSPSRGNKSDKDNQSSRDSINIRDGVLCPEASSQTYSCKPSKESFSQEYDFNPNAEEIFEYYKAAVKLITAPKGIHKDIVNTLFNQVKMPFHHHIKRIITDAAWDENLPGKDSDESLLKIHSLLDITRTLHSNPLYDIIDKLVQKIDEERGEGKNIFKNDITSTLELKCDDGKIVSSNTASTIEAITDEHGRFSPANSIDCEFLNWPEFKEARESLEKHAECANDSWKRDVFPSMAVIFSCKSIGEESSIKSMHLNMFVHEGAKHSVNYTINAILYHDRTENEKGVYKTEILNKGDNLQEKCEKLVTNEKIQALHFLYERQ
ncbi:hypothetical protein ENBRE01_2448 [Enteropsectra breve]|nr:hypothetical protein ENBRE01_2448 [Enteropsectra breve]